MVKGTGKLLSAEQSWRLKMVESVDREQMIAAIVAGLRAVTKPKRLGSGGPNSFYSRPASTR